MKKRAVLVIIDGWGVGRKDHTNPIHEVQPKTFAYIQENYLIGSLQASGIAVGLPWGEVGNSEVGHLTIGAGRVIYQHYPRITMAIQSGEFFKNDALKEVCSHVKQQKSALHIASLLTEGHVHAAFEHFEAMIQMAKKEGIERVYLHVFTDGKDGRPKAAKELLAELEAVTKREGVGIIASIAGRHFAMDRDSHYDRTEAAYRVMTGLEESVSELLPQDVARNAYEDEKTDEDVPPTRFSKEGVVASNDGLVFLNYREDSIRQIARSFIMEDFPHFERKDLKNLKVATMTEYTKEFQVPVAFPPEDVTMPLGRVLAEAGKTQAQIAETEKYAHVTYFFNGFRDESFENQEKILIPSQNVESHANAPEMRAKEIADGIIEKIKEGKDFVVANFANADLVAHTGNYAAEVEAIKVLDKEIGRVVKACEAHDINLVITADHGNAEVLIDPIKGTPQTGHDPDPVPIYVIGKDYKREKTPEEGDRALREVIGMLSDVAPTVLATMDVAQPEEMTGTNVIPILE